MTKQEYEARSNQYDECMQLPLALEYIASLEAENATLTADNLSLVEQVNECGVKYEKLITWLSDYFANHDFCMKQDMGCIDSFVSCEQCWREWLEKGGE